ncbi:TusE/DsrC/DsvC family sulfur relay protein [Chloroflexota bacterium]
MPKATLGGMEIEIDEDGFIQEPEKWNKEVAEDLGKIEAQYTAGADRMGDDHWTIVNYLRDYYLEYEIAPPIRMVTRKTGIDLKKIYELFPKGPAVGGCKVAGLPKPTGCV